MLTQLEIEIRRCQLCSAFLKPNPIFQVSSSARVIIIGQAPGSKADASGIPWDDESGKRLRSWLGLNDATFYNKEVVALMPMGFCYPGTGKSGDLPPRPECAPTWHDALLAEMADLKLKILIGKYALDRYLGKGTNLTGAVKNWREHLQNGILPLVHPSPRNRFWVSQNPWFESEMLPEVEAVISATIS